MVAIPGGVQGVRAVAEIGADKIRRQFPGHGQGAFGALVQRRRTGSVQIGIVDLVNPLRRIIKVIAASETTLDGGEGVTRFRSFLHGADPRDSALVDRQYIHEVRLCKEMPAEPTDTYCAAWSASLDSVR